MLYTVGDLTDATVVGEVFKVCKYGGPVTINVTETGVLVPGGTVNRQVAIGDGECRTASVVYSHANGNSPTVDVTVSEVVPAGFQLDSIRLLTGPTTVASTLLLTNSAGASIGGAASTVGLQGGVAILYNSVPGGEGCTPAFWRRSDHFDSWTGLSPNQLFSSVFEDAFPGKTMLQVLNFDGAGLKGLGRHAVAALLNANSPDVDYDLTAAEIIAGFNAAFPDGDIDGFRLQLAILNEQGCPLR